MELVIRVLVQHRKPEIPEKAKNEAKLFFQHQILSNVETSLRYAQVANTHYHQKDPSTWR